MWSHTLVCDMRMWPKSEVDTIGKMATWREGVGSVEKKWPKSEDDIIGKMATWRERERETTQREREESGFCSGFGHIA